jgi:translation elongation factor EF-1beta
MIVGLNKEEGGCMNVEDKLEEVSGVNQGGR